jgi:tape measure domain-containing protein
VGNILEFFIKMKDLMSGPLTKLVSSSQSSFGKIQSFIDNTINKNRKLAESFNNVDRGGGSGGGGFMALAKRVAIGAGIIALAAKSVTFGMDSIQKAMEFGSTKISFEVLTGDAGKGQALANDLNKLQQDTILGPEVFKNAQTMLGFGIATEKVLPTLKTLGDVSMGNADKMQSLTLAYSQVQAAGRLMGQDLLQFINAGFNPLQQISKDTGLSIGQLKKKMEEGAISSDMVAMAFQRATGEGGLFHNMLNRLADTPAGKMQQLQGQFEAFKVRLGEALMPLATVGLQWMEKLLSLANQVIPYIISGVNLIQQGIASLSDPTSTWGGMVSMVGEIFGKIWNIVRIVSLKIASIVNTVVAWASKSELVRDIFQVIGTVVSFVLDIVGHVIDAIGFLYTNTLKPILDAIEWIYVKIKGIVGLGDQATNQLANAQDAQGGSTNIFKPKDTKVTASGVASDANIFKSLMGGGAKEKGGGSDVAKGITGGGPRVINISIGKVQVAERMEVKTADTEDFMQQVEPHLENSLLKILNSGATVQ